MKKFLLHLLLWMICIPLLTFAVVGVLGVVVWLGNTYPWTIAVVVLIALAAYAASFTSL
jgi:hypothetical protein